MAGWPRTSLRTRLVALVLLAVLPALGLILHSGLERRRLEAKEARDTVLRVAIHAADRHATVVEATRDLLRVLAETPTLRERDWGGCSRFLAALLTERYANLGVLDRDGRVVCGAHPASIGLALGDQAFFRRATAAHGFAVGDYQPSPVTGRPTVGVALPVLDQRGTVEFVATAQIDLGWLGRLAAATHLGPGAAFVLVDPRGTVLARHPDGERWRGQPWPDAPAARGADAAIEGVQERVGVDGVRRFYAIARLRAAPDTEPPTLAVGIPTAVALAEADRALARNLTGLLVVGLLALGAAWVGGDALVRRPARRLAAAAEQLGAGDLSTRVASEGYPGELQDLADAFDRMAAGLQARQAEVSLAEATLRQQAHDLAITVRNRDELLGLLDSLYATAPVGLAFLDRELRFVRLNAMLAAINGLPPEAHLGRTPREVFPALAPRIESSLHQVLVSGEPLVGVELAGETPAFPGQTRHWLASYYPVTVRGDGAGGVGVVVAEITERRRGEAALRASQERLRLMVTTSGIRGWTWDIRQDRVTCLMPSGESEYEFGTLADFCAVVHPDDRERIRRAFDASAASGTDYQSEFRVVEDGAERWLLGRGTVLRDTQGTPLLMAGVNIDVTERQRLAAVLQTSEERFRTVAELVPELVWTTWPDGRVEFFNRRWYDYTGQTPEEARKHGWTAILHPGDREQTWERWQLALRTMEPLEVEYRLQGADGRYRWFLARALPLKDRSGRVEKWFGSCTDIEDQKRLEVALRRTSERLAALHEIDRAILSAQSAEAIARVTIQGLRKRLGAARAMVALFDLAAGTGERLAVDVGVGHPTAGGAGVRFPLEMVGDLDALRRGEPQTIADLATLAHHEPAAQLLAEVEGMRAYVVLPLLAEGELIGSLHIGSQTPGAFPADAIELGLEVAAPLAIALRQARLRAEVDSHAEELEARVRTRTAELEGANRELESFSYSVSHDLRAPLRAIDGFSRILEQEHAGLLPPGAVRYLDIVRDNARRMGELIDDLLAFSRLGRQALQRRPVAMTALVRDIVADLHLETLGRRVEVAVGELPAPDADPTLLRQAVLNLLDNAVKFTRPRALARIEVGAQPEGEPPVYFVRDNGVGFDMRYASKLFGVFQRLHDVREFPGTGVGLAIVQRVVHRHGGRVWAESTLDAGTTFSFTLGGAESDA